MFSIEKWREEDGAAAVEYGLLVGLIAVFIIASVGTLGVNIGGKFVEASCAIQSKAYNAPTSSDKDGSCGAALP